MWVLHRPHFCWGYLILCHMELVMCCLVYVTICLNFCYYIAPFIKTVLCSVRPAIHYVAPTQGKLKTAKSIPSTVGVRRVIVALGVRVRRVRVGHITVGVRVATVGVVWGVAAVFLGVATTSKVRHQAAIWEISITVIIPLLSTNIVSLLLSIQNIQKWNSIGSPTNRRSTCRTNRRTSSLRIALVLFDFCRSTHYKASRRMCFSFLTKHSKCSNIKFSIGHSFTRFDEQLTLQSDFLRRSCVFLLVNSKMTSYVS